MRDILRKLIRWLIYLLLVPVIYLIIALILTYIPVNGTESDGVNNHHIYLSTNGVHLFIIIPVENIDPELGKGLSINQNDKYISFGWGEENFYLNTQTWDDLTFGNAFRALFIESPTLIHSIRYKQNRSTWVKINISETELSELNRYISESFKRDASGNIIGIESPEGYSKDSNFYKANGSYSCFKTCNTWVNSAFKTSGLKACLWTPFDFGLIGMHRK